MKDSSRMVRGLVAALLGVVLCTAAGCSSDAGTQPEPTEPAPSVSETASEAPQDPASPAPALDSVDSIVVNGAFGAAPEVSAPYPFSVSELTVKVITPAPSDKGKVAAGGDITVNYVGINATTGEKFDSSFDRGSNATFSLGGGVIEGFAQGLSGQAIGSRVLLVIPASQGYGSSGNPNANIGGTDTLVFVVDIDNGLLAEPYGKVTDSSSRPMDVSFDPEPKVTINERAAASPGAQAYPIIAGDGVPVAPESEIAIKYLIARDAPGGEVLFSSYDKAPATVKVADLVEGLKTTLPGLQQGTRVGVRVPAAAAYPNGNEKINVKAGDDLIFIMDILLVTNPTG